MIEHLPLELFGDPEDDGDSEEAVVQDAEAATEVPIRPEVLRINCQWCGRQFDNELPKCPHCDATHITLVFAPGDPEIVVCQWCQTGFLRGPTTCPVCEARVVVPGQRVPGENDEFPDFAARGMLARNAQSHQLLAGMMAGGSVDSLTAGLIGLALSLLDDD